MLNEEDYSIIGFMESMTALEGCVREFKLAQQKIRAAAINSWNGVQLKSAEKKLQLWISELNDAVEVTYKEFHKARRARGLTEDLSKAESSL